MKLIIQIPCYNEEEMLPTTLADLPRDVAGFDSVEWLVIDDGSTDRTAEVASEHGVDHVVSLPSNRGLAFGFMRGLEECLSRGADVIVNTDADNQYNAADIPELVQPILDGKADMVIGARPIWNTGHFSIVKKVLQNLGSFCVRLVSGTNVEDAPSGFRAFTRETASRLNVFNGYTYTLETIIQAGLNNFTVASVPVRTNGPTRPSRLIKSMSAYIRKSLLTMFRISMTYRPFPYFATLAGILCAAGFFIGCRFLVLFAEGQGDGNIQSLILSSLLVCLGAMSFVLAALADLVSVNRRLLEKQGWRLQQLLDRQVADGKVLERQGRQFDILLEESDGDKYPRKAA